MRSKLALVITALGLSVPCAAHTQFLGTYSQWHYLDKTNKALYAAGFIDGGEHAVSSCLEYIDKDLKDIKGRECLARIDGMTTCIADNKLNGSLFKQWSNSPRSIITIEMEKLCQPWVERSRQKFHVSQ